MFSINCQRHDGKSRNRKTRRQMNSWSTMLMIDESTMYAKSLAWILHIFRHSCLLEAVYNDQNKVINLSWVVYPYFKRGQLQYWPCSIVPTRRLSQTPRPQYKIKYLNPNSCTKLYYHTWFLIMIIKKYSVVVINKILSDFVPYYLLPNSIHIFSQPN